MTSNDRKPILHVVGGLAVCAGVVASGAFDGVHTEIGYEHYAEPTVPGLPALVAMPANCLVNMAYLLLGWYWLPSGSKKGQACYLQGVFATMALAYGPVQWVRLWTQHHRAAVLDQWLTLLIFTWAAIWCHFLERGWRPGTFLAMEAASAASYGLALLHPQGFELALGGHIFTDVWKVFRVQKHLGDTTSACILAVGMVSCLGFVCLKLWDHELAQWTPFQRLTGHFWSKICDVLQFHCTFLFLTRMDRLRSQ
ncbi:transmembrane protein 187 [Eublepharis macularius]|uniref:Transmembrane protein 187 n=1 Tax=Eublepharis macularius TaxID=481883 RepID=A0AA97KJ83_EUBMA|nr:transmembrane protein 187 [Eublepharis macularius]